MSTRLEALIDHSEAVEKYKTDAPSRNDCDPVLMSMIDGVTFLNMIRSTGHHQSATGTSRLWACASVYNSQSMTQTPLGIDAP